ncbi:MULTISPECIES: SDR family oxidoreductase [unclassified Inquilinus]|uniref:SDR family oxidoreductase n=1 Tax=unclassified Inquilinus TaxID=2645927 RepID=UPI003F90044C
MRVLVIGGYGLIGGYVLSRLHRQGHAVVGAGREIRMAARRFPYARWVAADLAAMRRPQDWAPHLAGIDAVVNCAGALQDSPRDDLRAVHVDGALALYRACAAAGIRRVVHVSAAAVGAGRETAFNATKQAAEAALAGLDLDWVVLRPGLVLAPAAYGGTALLRGLAGFPGIIPAVHADSVVQLVSAEDVAEAVGRAIDPAAPARIALDLMHPDPVRLAELLVALRGWLGLPPAPVLRLPAGLARIPAAASDAIARLGWRSPMRSTALAQLRMGIAGDGETWQRVLGLRPRSLAEMLAGWPSGVQERWFARLYFLKPLAFAALILFWLASGLIGLARLDQAAAVLRDAGVPAGLAVATVGVGSAVDLALAVLACFRRSAGPALLGMVAVSAAYLLGGTLLRPDLWADPLGPLVKVIPGAVLALAALAMLDER